MNETRAIRATVTGHVQGVGFREATRREAERLGVSGWVSNESDGSVAVHAEGAAVAVGRLETFLREGPHGASVDEVSVADAESSSGADGFDIR